MKTQLNLASRPLLNTTPLSILLAALLLAALGLTTWNLALYLNTRSEARAVESQLLQIREEESALEEQRAQLTRKLEATDLVALERRVNAANAVLAEKTISWNLLLERLQELMPWKVKLEAISASPRPDGVGLSLSLVTPEHDYYWDLIQKLEAHPCFSDVYPTNQKGSDGEELEVVLQLQHDPWCGQGNPNPSTRSKRRGGNRG